MQCLGAEKGRSEVRCYHPSFRRDGSKSSGAPNTIRTCDPRLRRAVLYPSELWARKIQDAGLGKTNRIAFFLSAVHSDNFALCFNKHVSMQYNDHFFLRELL